MKTSKIKPEAESEVVPRTVVVTLLYRSGTTFPSFLRQLQAQDVADWILVLVDNNPGGDAAAAALARVDKRVRLILNYANFGFARGTNQGLRAGLALGAPLMLLLNNDVSFGPGFLRELLAARDRLKADVIAPRVMKMECPNQAWYAGGHFDYGMFFKNDHDTEFDPDAPPTSRVVEFASGCCLGLTPAALHRVGLLDERFFVYWEDVDYSLRLGAAGIPIHYVSEPFLLHAGNVSSGGAWSPVHLSLYYRAYIHLLRKHFGAAHAWRVAVLLMAREAKWRDKGPRQLAAMTVALFKGLTEPPQKTTPLHQESG